MVAYSPRSKLGTLLPEFPNVRELKLPSNVPEEKVSDSHPFTLTNSVKLGFWPPFERSLVQTLLDNFSCVRELKPLTLDMF